MYQYSITMYFYVKFFAMHKNVYDLFPKTKYKKTLFMRNSCKGNWGNIFFIYQCYKLYRVVFIFHIYYF